MGTAEEQVAVYDVEGRAVGAAPRHRVRAEGLWHAATAVLVRSCDGRDVFVHRRTDTKDVYPGRHDCWAGGVLAAGETPSDGASRELFEELGIDAAPRFAFRTRHVNGSIRFHAFLYEVFWNGPLTLQAAEVAEGWWLPLAELRARLDDASWPFVPDGRQFVLEWLDRRE